MNAQEQIAKPHTASQAGGMGRELKLQLGTSLNLQHGPVIRGYGGATLLAAAESLPE